LRVDCLCLYQGSLTYTRRSNSMGRHKKRLNRRIREIESTNCIIRRRFCLIIPLSAIIGHWNVSFVFLFVDSMLCNPNIYSSSTEGPNNKWPLLFPFFCHSRAPLLFLSNWDFFLFFFYKNLYKVSLKRISYFEKDLDIHLTRSLTTHYMFLE